MRTFDLTPPAADCGYDTVPMTTLFIEHQITWTETGTSQSLRVGKYKANETFNITTKTRQDKTRQNQLYCILLYCT